MYALHQGRALEHEFRRHSQELQNWFLNFCSSNGHKSKTLPNLPAQRNQQAGPNCGLKVIRCTNNNLKPILSSLWLTYSFLIVSPCSVKESVLVLDPTIHCQKNHLNCVSFVQGECVLQKADINPHCCWHELMKAISSSEGLLSFLLFVKIDDWNT